jgi:hypothetical protein
MLNRDEMLENLRSKICEVVFTKANGEERLMECTLMESEIPAEMLPKSDGNTSDRPASTEVIRVFDVGINQWRSFRIDSVTQFA